MPAGMLETGKLLPVGAISTEQPSWESRLIPATETLFFHRHDVRGNVLRIILLERQAWHRGVWQHQEGSDDFGRHAWLRRNRRERDDGVLFCRGCANGVTVGTPTFRQPLTVFEVLRRRRSTSEQRNRER